MGSCTSKQESRKGDINEIRVLPKSSFGEKREAQVSREIDHDIESSAVQSVRVKKLLLLGTGESGKSTLWRQMKRIYGVGFTKQELEVYKTIVVSNTVLFMVTILNATDKFRLQISKSLDPKRIQLKNEILKLGNTEFEYDAKLASVIAELWQDPALKAAFELRSQYQLPDCANYFFDKAVEMGDPKYIPTNTDILMSRVRTTGILETRFKISGTVFDIFDVGGQRNERKKWIHCFDSVTAIIFVIAMSEYDQVLLEDEKVNRMTEALELFEETVNSKWFTKVDIIVFLNKMDLLTKKIVKVPISKYFPQYTGGPDLDLAAQFFMELVLARNHMPMRGIYCHMTNATDEANVIYVFSAVRDIVLRKGMAGIGLL